MIESWIHKRRYPEVHAMMRSIGRGARPLLAAIVVGTMFSGCGGWNGKTDPPEDPVELSGRWELELKTGSTFGSGRRVQGELLLSPSPARTSTCYEESATLCRTIVYGHHRIQVQPLLGYALPDTVGGGVDADGSAFLMIGGCCHQGEITLRGESHHSSMQGKWRADRRGKVQTGTFTLRRL